MELLITVLLWFFGILAGLVALPFVLMVSIALFGVIAFAVVASLFSVTLVSVALISFLVEKGRQVAGWFKRTAGCQ